MAVQNLANKIDCVDRLNEIACVVSFMGEAMGCMLQEDYPQGEDRRFGLYLVFNWIEGQVREVHDFFDAKPA